MKLLFVIFIFQFTIYSQWITKPSGTQQGLFTTSFIDANYGFCFGEREQIIKTTDGGINWQMQVIPKTSYVYASTFLDSLNGWLTVIDYGSSSRAGKIIHTSDGGANWEVQETIYGYVTHTIHFINHNIGWVTGSNGLLLKTVNGGITWEDRSLPIYEWLYPIYFINQNTGWLSGNTNGVIYKTNNGGSSWQTYYAPTSDFLMSIHFVDNNTGWAAGHNGRVLKTTNGGANWVIQNTGTTAELRQIYFKDLNNGWVVGYNGTILRTINGGQTWTQEASGTTTNLFGISIGGNTGYVVGDNGLVLKNENILTNVSDFQYNPAEFYLSQNYPNPFNPLTTISYKIPKRTFVTLKILDVLGNQVKVLIEDEVEKGNYEIKFYSSELTSGVYFYRITASEFSETKKMIIMK